MSDLDQFEKAFSSCSAGSVTECACGRVFWDTSNNGWDWEEGEEDALRADPNATGVPYATERIIVDGALYANDCNCWHQKARRIEEFLRENQRYIGQWYKLEKERLSRESTEVPAIAG